MQCLPGEDCSECIEVVNVSVRAYPPDCELCPLASCPGVLMLPVKAEVGTYQLSGKGGSGEVTQAGTRWFKTTIARAPSCR